MKITSISQNIIQHNLIRRTANTASNTNYLRTLNADTVSFGYLNEEVNQNIQLYRSIGKSEYEKLLNNEVICSAGYATSDPRGWEAHSWDSGYVFNHADDFYFVTFKCGKLPISSRRDSIDSTRYGIERPYTINDIENIRKGNNVHGVLVYSENFAEAKRQDIKQKIKNIELLKNKLTICQNDKIRDEIWDELKSYVNEFPDILAKFESVVNHNNKIDLAHFYGVILNLIENSPKTVNSFRKFLYTCCNNNAPVLRESANFLQRLDSRDVSLVLKLHDNNKFNTYILGSILANIVKDNQYEKIIENHINPNNIKDVHLMSVYYICKNNPQDVNKIRKLLSNLPTKKPPRNLCDGALYSATIENFAKYLAQNGNIDDISILEKFCNSNNHQGFHEEGVWEAIQKITNKHNDIS